MLPKSILVKSCDFANIYLRDYFLLIQRCPGHTVHVNRSSDFIIYMHTVLYLLKILLVIITDLQMSALTDRADWDVARDSADFVSALSKE